MELSKAIRTLNSLRKGTYTNFTYTSEVPVKAEFKDIVKITKYCNATGRFGIHYGNLTSVKNREADSTIIPKKAKTDNKVWILKNMIEYNKNTDKFYLNVYSSPNKTKKFYMVSENGKETRMIKSLDEVEKYVLPSYLKRTNNHTTEFYKVTLDNVLKIGK